MSNDLTGDEKWLLLANVNSCSRSPSVTFVHPTQPVEILDNVCTPFGTLAIRYIPTKFYGDRPRGTPPSGLKARG